MYIRYLAIEKGDFDHAIDNSRTWKCHYSFYRLLNGFDRSLTSFNESSWEFYSSACDDYFFLQHDPVIRSKHDVSQYLSRIRKGTLLFPQT